jgi:hypothetical protein
MIDWCKAYAEYLKKSGLFKKVKHHSFYSHKINGEMCEVEI